MLPLVTARPVGFGRGFGGRFCQGKHMAGKLRPLEVERETRPGKYFDGDGLYLVVKGATSRNWIYRFRKDGKERWLGLALQLRFLTDSESIGNHDSKIVGACGVD